MGNRAIGKTLHYALASIGPIGAAVGQFLITLLLLRTLSAPEFGAFSFLLVVSQFLQGIWGALFCAPLLIALTRSAETEETPPHRAAAILNVSLVLDLILFAAMIGMAMLMRLPFLDALLFAAFAALGLIRWLARALHYAIGKGYRTNISDLLYAGVLIAAACALWAVDGVSLTNAFAALLAATLLALPPLVPAYMRAQFQPGGGGWRGYAPAWREQGRWALTGVVTTEATVNAHAYIVTGLLGAAAFAPLAATALIIRPANVVVNALGEFERAQMARKAAAGGDAGELAKSILFFRLVLALLWIGSAALAVLLLATPARGFFPAQYPAEVLITGMGLWLAVLAFRFARTPESTWLQAMDRYRPLAWASVWSCLFSVGAVLILLLLAGPLWSIAGIAIGEAAFALWTWRAARATSAHAMTLPARSPA